MAVLKVFSIFDSKVGAYTAPSFLQNEATCLRSLGDALLNDQHQFSRHASDYTLFCFGTWDEETGLFQLYPAPEPLMPLQALKVRVREAKALLSEAN